MQRRIKIRGDNILQLLLTKLATFIFTLQEKFSEQYFRKVSKASAFCSEAVNSDFRNGQKVLHIIVMTRHSGTPAIRPFLGQLATSCQLLVGLESARKLKKNGDIHWELDLNPAGVRSVSTGPSRC